MVIPSKLSQKFARITSALIRLQDFEPDDEEDEKSREKRRQLEIQKEIKALKKELKGGGGGKKGVKAKGEKAAEEAEEGDELTEEERANDMLRAFHEEQSRSNDAKGANPVKIWVHEKW